MPLPSRSAMESYVNNRKQLVRVICHTNQWSGLSENKIISWIRNFNNPEGRYIGMKLFLNSLYYSERNLIDLLKNGINEQIISNEIRQNQINEGNIYITKSNLNWKVRTELARTLFVPLSDNSNPSESGLALTRYLTNELQVSENNVLFHFQITSELLRNFNRIIILDDCVGSGQQLSNFWNGTSSFSGLKSLIPFRDIPTYFLALVGYETPIMDLQIDGYTEGLRVKINQVLNENHRVLQPNHKTWCDTEEWEFAMDYLGEICDSKGFSLYGYNEFDFAVFLHNTAPDWTLPLFWQTVEGEWVNLINRKRNII